MKMITVITVLMYSFLSAENFDSYQNKIDKAYEEYGGLQVSESMLQEVEAMSTLQIYDDLLRASPSPSPWQDARILVIKKRKDELSNKILETLKNPQLTIEVLGKLPGLASVISPELEAEIAGEVLRHPSSREFDTYFLNSKIFRDHFHASPSLLRSSLEDLVSEGRLEKDSPTYKEWEKTISSAISHREVGNSRNADSASQKKLEKNKMIEIAVAEKINEAEQNRLLWIISCVVLSGCIILFLKKRKG